MKILLSILALAMLTAVLSASESDVRAALAIASLKAGCGCAGSCGPDCDCGCATLTDGQEDSICCGKGAARRQARRAARSAPEDAPETVQETYQAAPVTYTTYSPSSPFATSYEGSRLGNGDVTARRGPIRRLLARRR